MRISDWSSDVCSSDLRPLRDHPGRAELEVILSLIRSCRMPRGHPGERFIPGIAHVPVCPVPSRISPTVHAECRAQRGVSRHARISGDRPWRFDDGRSEEHTSELQSLMRISYAVFCLKKKKKRVL